MNIIKRLFIKETVKSGVEDNQKTETLVAFPKQSFSGKIDTYSPTWIFIRDHLKGQLKELRKKNDNITTSFEKTQVIRGQIKEIKHLLDIIYCRKTSKHNEPKE